MIRKMKVKSVVIQEMDVPGLGARIEEARRASGRSLTKICSELGMSTANWYRIEQEKNESLPLETLRKIEAVLGVDLDVKF
jgi:transcriptional regulator with XRE-family HTH domain